VEAGHDEGEQGQQVVFQGSSSSSSRREAMLRYAHADEEEVEEQ
jgi:hypothetical protein